MFDRFSIPGSLLGAARLVGLLGGGVLTLACVIFGLSILTGEGFLRYPCSRSRKTTSYRVLEVHRGVAHYQIDEGRCPPTRDDLIKGKYVSRHALVDSWGTGIAYWCNGEDAEVRSAGPDKVFNTSDDVTSMP